MRRETIAWVAILAGVVGCDRGREAPPAPGPAISVVARPAALRLRSGESRQLAAQANDAAGAPIGGAPLVFSSKTPALLTVSAEGLVSSVGPAGSGLIEVASGDVHAVVDVAVVAGSTDALRVAAGGAQTGASGAVLAEAVAVRADDQRGNPVPGVVIRFASDSGGIVTPSEATTDDGGVASASWTLGPRAGAQSLVASVADDPETIATISATALAGAAARLEAFGEVGEVVAAGEALRVQVRAVDVHGNPAAEVPVTWTDDDGGRFEGASELTDAQGSAGASWYPRPAVGARRARVVSSALPDQAVELATTVRAGAAARLEVVAGDGQRGVASKPAKIAAVVRAVDAYGNPVANAAVSFAVTAGGGSVDAAPVVSDEAGLATSREWVLGAGANTLSATVAGLEASASVNATGRGRR